MDLSASTVWWLAAGALLAAEMTTGTFYLLMLAIGAAGAAVASHLGASVSTQLMVASALGGVAVATWHWRPRGTQGDAQPAIHLDIGERVFVSQWQSDHTARVDYRGSQWSARYAGAGTPEPGEHVIRAIDGSRLVLDR